MQFAAIFAALFYPPLEAVDIIKRPPAKGLAIRGSYVPRSTVYELLLEEHHQKIGLVRRPFERST